MSSEAKQLSLGIPFVRIDGGTQIREKLDDAVVQEYAERMQDGAVFPPVIVVYDGENYWLADGFHRLHALKLLEREAIDCLVYEGTLRDAILVAVKANSTHGLRRTNADKRRAAVKLLEDEEWSKKSNRWIAETCGVSRQLVDLIRNELANLANRPMEGGFGVHLGQDGKLRPAHRTMQTTDEPADPIEAALRCGDAFDACILHLRRVEREGERLAEGPGGRFFNGIRLADFRQCISQAVNAVAATRPSDRCSGCNGAGCERCEQAGWLCPGKRRLY